MRILITRGKDKGKYATVNKYIGDEAYRVFLDKGIKTVVYEGEFKRC
ncbi:hypothetical protein G7062_11395 [Erysipelothrix sp. HDW6C]|nr:hypothetical protein [Erysipelothrix sp. HDW6C]QIK70862.1 hypothetical protein G7062_11395 [Erysipelothrix sp. HDW6C]